jgi:hypothetical protein
VLTCTGCCADGQARQPDIFQRALQLCLVCAANRLTSLGSTPRHLVMERSAWRDQITPRDEARRIAANSAGYSEMISFRLVYQIVSLWL